MKIYFTLLFSLFLTTTYAQRNMEGDFSIAPQVGISVSSFNSNQNYDLKSRKSFTTGMTAEYYFAPRLSVRSGAMYRTMGAENSDGMTTKLNYISVPLGLVYHLGRNGKWYVNAGATGSHLITATQEDSDSAEYDAIDKFKPLDIGANLGVGYRIPCSDHVELFFDLQGYYGLLNVLNDDLAPIELRNISGSLNFGALFYL